MKDFKAFCLRNPSILTSVVKLFELHLVFYYYMSIFRYSTLLLKSFNRKANEHQAQYAKLSQMCRTIFAGKSKIVWRADGCRCCFFVDFDPVSSSRLNFHSAISSFFHCAHKIRFFALSEAAFVVFWTKMISRQTFVCTNWWSVSLRRSFSLFLISSSRSKNKEKILPWHLKIWLEGMETAYLGCHPEKVVVWVERRGDDEYGKLNLNAEW